jgi:hypothetical protein
MAGSIASGRCRSKHSDVEAGATFDSSASSRYSEQWISQRRATWQRRFDRLGDYLAEGPAKPQEGTP